MTPTKNTLLSLLDTHVASDASERDSIARVRSLIERVEAPTSRGTLEGHITGSAVVLDNLGRALLLFHARLGLWLQPGGHVEDGESPDEGAFREAREESGLPDLVLETNTDGTTLLLDVDVHPIPEHPKRGEPAHWHHDLCYVARTQQPEAIVIDPNESRDFRWIDAQELETTPVDGTTRRRLLKAFALKR
jgi:8-oxo-dGTP pyrophosphatase MutT (NUDIX family)